MLQADHMRGAFGVECEHPRVARARLLLSLVKILHNLAELNYLVGRDLYLFNIRK
jgi:hypothetical protein